MQLQAEFYLKLSQKFRSALTPIKGFTEILIRSKNLKDIQYKDLEVILKNIVRLEHIINSFEKKVFMIK